jgi:membrane associated rhomboid family serine protease
MFLLTPMVRNLVLLNLLIFIVGQVLQNNLGDTLGLAYLTSAGFQPYQLLTHLFVHADWLHILGNMFMLMVFGPKLEMTWGPNRFLVFYLACGYGASLLYSLVNAVELNLLLQEVQAYAAQPSFNAFDRFVATHQVTAFQGFVNDFGDHDTNPAYLAQSKEYLRTYYEAMQGVTLVGASGAIFGILLAFGMVFPHDIINLFFVFPVEARFVVIFYAALELYVTLQAAPNDNVAHFAHLGGMLFAFLFARRWSA